MPIDALIPLFLASVVLVLKPGPYMMAMISLSVAGKWKSMLTFWAGFFFASGSLYFALLTTLSQLPAGFGIVFIILKAVAGLIFINMGFSGLKEKISDYEESSQETQKKISGQRLLATVGVGFILSISNPFELVFILSVVPSLTGLTSFTLIQISYIFGTMIFANVLISISYCLPILLIRNFFNDKILKALKTFSSWAMIGIGLYIIVTMFLRWDLLQSGLISG